MSKQHQVYRFQNDSAVILEPDVVLTVSAEPLAQIPLLVSPGRAVAWEGDTYTLDIEGRYCFSCGKTIHNVLVFEHDYVSLFHGLSQIHLKGVRHRNLSIEERINAMKTGRLSVMCGGIASVTLELLHEFGHTARRIGLPGPSGNGHVVIEYFDQQHSRWVLVDIHNHVLLKNDGEFLSLADLYTRIESAEPFVVQRLSSTGGLDYFSWDVNGSGQFGLGSELILHDDAVAHRFFAAPDKLWGIWEEDKHCYIPVDSEALATEICGWSPKNRCLPWEQWRARFYGSPTT